MKVIQITELDNGKLIVNTDFLDILEANGLDSFESLMNYSEGTIVKQALKERYTTRITLNGRSGPVNFFLKRYVRPPIKEYFKQLLRFTKPIVGGKNEWEALIFLSEHGIPVPVPVAYGEDGRDSFTMTHAIENITRACDWLEDTQKDGDEKIQKRRQLLILELARIVKKLHDSGVNHQDLYLCHFLVRFENETPRVFLIDNQRAMIHSGYVPERWRIKDLAQFCFSASCLEKNELDYFFKEYGISDEKSLLKKIFRKKEKILKHTQKNRL